MDGFVFIINIIIIFKFDSFSIVALNQCMHMRDSQIFNISSKTVCLLYMYLMNGTCTMSRGECWSPEFYTVYTGIVLDIGYSVRDNRKLR